MVGHQGFSFPGQSDPTPSGAALVPVLDLGQGDSSSSGVRVPVERTPVGLPGDVADSAPTSDDLFSDMF